MIKKAIKVLSLAVSQLGQGSYGRAKMPEVKIKITGNSVLLKNQKEFRKNPRHFAKSVCKEIEGNESKALNCSSDEAFSHFSSSFEASSQGCEELSSSIKEVDIPSLCDEEAIIPMTCLKLSSCMLITKLLTF